MIDQNLKLSKEKEESFKIMNNLNDICRNQIQGKVFYSYSIFFSHSIQNFSFVRVI